MSGANNTTLDINRGGGFIVWYLLEGKNKQLVVAIT